MRASEEERMHNNYMDHAYHQQKSSTRIKSNTTTSYFTQRVGNFKKSSLINGRSISSPIKAVREPFEASISEMNRTGSLQISDPKKKKQSEIIPFG